MKTTKIFTIAAMALMLSACSSNDIEENLPQPNNKAEGIPFSATISIGEGATTRALTESGSTIVPSWAKGEKVALIHNNVIDEMTVQSVNDGVATITGTITGNPANGADVTIIYPSSAVDATTKDIKTDLLVAQDGTLATVAEKYDVRKGSGTLEVGTTASLYGNVSLTNQYAIFKFTTKKSDDTDLSVKPLIITIGTQTYFITPTSATNVLYVALPATSSTRVRFYATGNDSKAYVYSKGSVSFTAGNYYQSELKLKSTVLPGQFAVGSGTVQFSRGNLQAIYNGSEWTWVIATEQWDLIGTTSANGKINGNGTIDGTGTVDLFGWSTAATTYGIHNSEDNSTYSDDFVDWGNTIGGGWRTLSSAEWNDLFNSRTGSTVNGTANRRYTFADLPNAMGIILFPDGGSFDNTEASWGTFNDYSFWTTKCNAVQWTALEDKGCVFLSLTYDRDGTSVRGATYGRYWSSTSTDASTAVELYFKDAIPIQQSTARKYGFSVRLVRNVP